jgi:trans-aconitate methyltransferase
MTQWDPEDYAKHSDAQLQWAQALRRSFDWQGVEAILDVGCGDGKITADFAQSLPQSRAVGIDSSAAMIDYASRTHPPSRYANLSFACIDARSLSFEPVFDLCFSNSVLHWVDDHQAFLGGVARALRSGGRLLISCGGEGNTAGILQVFVELVANSPWDQVYDQFQNPYFFYGTREYEQWLPEAGLTIERLACVPKDMTHPGAAGLAAWIRTTWMPITHCLPEADRERFIADFVEAYLQKIPLDVNGLAHVHMVRLEVNAVKA